MRLRLSKFLMRMALVVLRPGPLDGADRMEDEEVAAALCVAPSHPVWRGVMELLRRHADAARAECYAERNAARNPTKTTYYAASAGTAADMIDYLESARVAALAGRAPEKV